MKICFVIAEYNPFHNGHLRQMEIIKRDIHPDYTVIVMRDNFTQRGEIAVLDKYTRASHAVLAGADAVIELPVIFSTANAEVFAKGAVSLINSVNGQKTLCFGAEKADKQNFLKVAKIWEERVRFCVKNENALVYRENANIQINGTAFFKKIIRIDRL